LSIILIIVILTLIIVIVIVISHARLKRGCRWLGGTPRSNGPLKERPRSGGPGARQLHA